MDFLSKYGEYDTVSESVSESSATTVIENDSSVSETDYGMSVADYGISGADFGLKTEVSTMIPEFTQFDASKSTEFVQQNYSLVGIRKLNESFEVHEFVANGGDPGAIIFRYQTLPEPTVRAFVHVKGRLSNKVSAALVTESDFADIEDSWPLAASDEYGDYPSVLGDQEAAPADISLRPVTDSEASDLSGQSHVPLIVGVSLGKCFLLLGLLPS